MRYLFLLPLLVIAQIACAQVTTIHLDQDPVFIAVLRRLRYPFEAEQAGIYARIYAGFRIDQQGHVQDVCILNPVKVGYGFEEEVIQKIRRLPPLQFRYKGEYALPVTFAFIDHADSNQTVVPAGYLSGSYLMGRTLLNEQRIVGDRTSVRKRKIITVVSGQLLEME